LIKWSVSLGFASADRPLRAPGSARPVEVERHVYGWGCDRLGGSSVLDRAQSVAVLAVDALLHVLGIDLERSLPGDVELGADLLATPAMLVSQLGGDKVEPFAVRCGSR
jgi:hypothetical protein